MAKLLKLRRGTTSQHSSFTGAEGEVTVDTDKDVLVVHDGSTAGGHPVAAQDMDNVPAGAILGTQLENSGVTAGQYGSSSAIPIVTVDAQGLVTAASTTAIDSTTIANGSASVAVASNGPITSNANHDFSAGIDVTGAITSTGNMTITNDAPKIFLTDGSNNPDFSIQNANGAFVIFDDTNSAVRLEVNADGHVDVKGNLDCEAGVDVTGNITASGDIVANGGDIEIAGSIASLNLTDTGNNPDWRVQNYNGEFHIYDVTNSATRIKVNTDGHVDITSNLDCTGNLVASDGTFNGGDLTVSGTTAVIHLTDTNNNDDFSVMNANGNFIIRDVTNSLDRLLIDSNGSGTINGGSYQFNVSTTTFNSSTDEKIVIRGSNSPYIRFKNAGGSDTAYLQHNNDGNIYLWNQSVNRGLQLGSQPYFYDGAYRQIWHANNDGSGSGLDADTVDGIQGASFLRSDTADSTNALITASAGLRPGNLSVGESAHSNTIQQVSGGTLHLQYNVSGNLYVNEGGGFMQARTIRPEANNSYDLGTSSARWRNIYTNDLHLSNVGHSNDVDGTWGDWTIQEGESDLFLKNNRSGKKYKFNLMEVS